MHKNLPKPYDKICIIQIKQNEFIAINIKFKKLEKGKPWFRTKKEALDKNK